jgi:hypothetical protein
MQVARDCVLEPDWSIASEVIEFSLEMTSLILVSVPVPPSSASHARLETEREPSSLACSRSFFVVHVLTDTRKARNARITFTYFLTTRRNLSLMFTDRLVSALLSDSVEKELSRRAKKRFKI